MERQKKQQRAYVIPWNNYFVYLALRKDNSIMLLGGGMTVSDKNLKETALREAKAESGGRYNGNPKNYVEVEKVGRNPKEVTKKEEKGESDIVVYHENCPAVSFNLSTPIQGGSNECKAILRIPTADIIKIAIEKSDETEFAKGLVQYLNGDDETHLLLFRGSIIYPLAKQSVGTQKIEGGYFTNQQNWRTRDALYDFCAGQAKKRKDLRSKAPLQRFSCHK